ncbi:hypothetical protein L798_12197 [Zootermopsis nevadensis]|uniref:Uncharacterized protein n=1 Tax=Zootermopsis nevadensis TaxID=136037 RepID=A0A067R688_ZOONE|nr:hypothetical protein L798_12197 [Zootermopsis nevadensis]
MTEAVWPLVNNDQTTQRNNPEDGNLHTHRCENLKSYTVICVYEFFCLQIEAFTSAKDKNLGSNHDLDLMSDCRSAHARMVIVPGGITYRGRKKQIIFSTCRWKLLDGKQEAE